MEERLIDPATIEEPYGFLHNGCRFAMKKVSAAVARAVIVFQQYMIPRIEARRETPRDDLLSDLAIVEIDDGEFEAAAG